MIRVSGKVEISSVRFRIASMLSKGSHARTIAIVIFAENIKVMRATMLASKHFKSRLSKFSFICVFSPF